MMYNNMFNQFNVGNPYLYTGAISINVSSVAGTISHVCATALKNDPS